MASSQKLFAVQTLYPVVTSNYVLGLRLEFARFYGETGHFKLNFSIEDSNFSQFFLSGIHIHTFSHNFAKKNISFHRHFKVVVRACHAAYHVAHVFKYLVPNFVSGRPA